MANKRIKDLTQTATTLASDDYVAIDGSSNGTRKIVKGDLVNDISSQVAGTYLDEANNLSDVASLDTSKLNLEVPDVGTAPNEVPLNGMLGDMAYQSSDGVSAAKIEVESTTGTATTQALTVTDGSSTNFVVQEDGSVGVGTSSPSSYYTASDDLVVAGASNRGISIISGATSSSSIAFGSGTGTDAYRGKITYDNNAHSLSFNTLSATRWTINSSGNLVSSGGAIDFGSGAAVGRTVESGLLDDYERGQWSPRFEMTGANFATVTMEVVAAHYVKIGRFVHCQAEIRTDNIDATGASGSVAIQGLPFTSESTSGNSSSLSVGYGAAWVTAPASGYVPANSTYAVLTRYTTTGTSTLSASDLTAGATADRNQLNFSVSYVTAS